MRFGMTVVLVVALSGCVPPPARVDVARTEGQDKSYAVDLPVGWIRHYLQNNSLVASRDGFDLQTIGVAHLPLDGAFPKTKRKATDGMLPSELAEMQIAELKTTAEQMAALDVTENEPASLDGRDGFRVRLRYRTPRGLEIHRVIYGVADKSGYYRLEYESPKLHYFDKTYGDFEKSVASFRILAGSKTAAN